MEQIELIEVNFKYADDILKFRQEILECDAENEDQFAGCMSLDTSKSAEEWIKICELRKSEETCNEVGTAVPSHTYIAVRKNDDKVVGVLIEQEERNEPLTFEKINKAIIDLYDSYSRIPEDSRVFKSG